MMQYFFVAYSIKKLGKNFQWNKLKDGKNLLNLQLTKSTQNFFCLTAVQNFLSRMASKSRRTQHRCRKKAKEIQDLGFLRPIKRFRSSKNSTYLFRKDILVEMN